MKAKIKILLLLFLVLTLSSCANFNNFHNNKARGKAGIVRVPQFEINPITLKSQKDGKQYLKDTLIDQGSFLWSYYDATKRGSVMYVKDGKIRVLAENAPDAAIQSITEITTKIKGLKGDVGEVEAALKTQRAIAELGKRTAAVNMLRDALYRLNEMYYATVDEKETLRKFFIDNKINLETYKLFSDEYNKANKTLSEEKLVQLFERIIDKAAEISIAESNAEAKISEGQSIVSLQKLKNEEKKYDAIIDIIKKISGNLTKEEAEKYLKEFNLK